MDMECQGNCSEADFTMECDLNSDGDELDCKGDGIWSDYTLEWDKDE